ncbi:hypothetical protein E1218_02245 [Kribbella turkmenica]|uniref:DUF4192 family protein n=1 Tax=Kribbella turkmenica TaxID=2530375 RepID=A0A4R4XH31_9ACTN|nr:hypothetical protein [Kribbella turkmenica]TDD30126.1 hypothetical protein E1218_02245 [Kribbella turkmenica]
MSFQDLPPTWTDHPLSDPCLATDVVDLLVSLGDRHRGTFTVVLCDQDTRYRAALAVDLPSEFEHQGRSLAAGDLCTSALTPIMPAVRTAPGTTMLLALGRPGPPTLPALDTEWATAATRTCQAAQVPLLGFYVATPQHIYEPLRPAVAAA